MGGRLRPPGTRQSRFVCFPGSAGSRWLPRPHPPPLPHTSLLPRRPVLAQPTFSHRQDLPRARCPSFPPTWRGPGPSSQGISSTPDCALEALGGPIAPLNARRSAWRSLLLLESSLLSSMTSALVRTFTFLSPEHNQYIQLCDGHPDPDGPQLSYLPPPPRHPSYSPCGSGHPTPTQQQVRYVLTPPRPTLPASPPPRVTTGPANRPPSRSRLSAQQLGGL